MLDQQYIRSRMNELILEWLDEGITPPDIIEAVEYEIGRFEELVYDYE